MYTFTYYICPLTLRVAEVGILGEGEQLVEGIVRVGSVLSEGRK